MAWNNLTSHEIGEAWCLHDFFTIKRRRWSSCDYYQPTATNLPIQLAIQLPVASFLIPENQRRDFEKHVEICTSVRHCDRLWRWRFIFCKSNKYWISKLWTNTIYTLFVNTTFGYLSIASRVNSENLDSDFFHWFKTLRKREWHLTWINR